MPNIQSSFKKLIRFIAEIYEDGSFLGFHKALADCNWMRNISLMLNLTNKMVLSLKGGRSVFVHCSDGWDRTAQASAGAQLLLDSYYRTLEGFFVLVEKEFVLTGHMFRKRLGVFSKDSHNRSPIFLQFLDGVQNILHLNPNCFQFNQNFLRDFGLVAYFGCFSNFLCDSELQRKKLKIRRKTLHTFDFFNIHKQHYVNRDFEPSEPVRKVPLFECNLRFWKEFFFMYFEQNQESLPVPMIN